MTDIRSRVGTPELHSDHPLALHHACRRLVSDNGDFGVTSMHSSMFSSPWSPASLDAGISNPPSVGAASPITALSRQPSNEALSDDHSMKSGYGDGNNNNANRSHAPEFVMPQLSLPRRKLPTLQGSQVGTLRVLVCGTQGIGKSSLIKALVQGSGDILLAGDETLTQQVVNPTSPTESLSDVPCVSESWASTTILPPWKRGARSFDRLNDEVIVRNLCFVHLPSDKEAVLKYVQEQFKRTDNLLTYDIPAGFQVVDLLSTGCGGISHVDVCLYLIDPSGLTSHDLDFFKAIQNSLNILPLIAQSDTLSSEELAQRKVKIIDKLRENDIKFFTCGHTLDTLKKNAISSKDASTPPFAVSSKPLNESKMSSLDMSVAFDDDELYASELKTLRTVLFHTHTAWLRATTAEKFLKWRSQHHQQHQPNNALIPFSNSSSPSPFTVDDTDDPSLKSFIEKSIVPDVSSSDLENVGAHLLNQLQRLEDVRLRMKLSMHVRERRMEMDRLLFRFSENMEREFQIEMSRRRREFLQRHLQECDLNDEKENSNGYSLHFDSLSSSSPNQPNHEPDPLHWSSIFRFSKSHRKRHRHKEMPFRRHPESFSSNSWDQIYQAAVWCAFGAVAGVVVYAWWS